MFAPRRANSAASVHQQQRICSDLHRTNTCDQSSGIVLRSLRGERYRSYAGQLLFHRSRWKKADFSSAAAQEAEETLIHTLIKKKVNAKVDQEIQNYCMCDRQTKSWASSRGCLWSKHLQTFKYVSIFPLFTLAQFWGLKFVK